MAEQHSVVVALSNPITLAGKTYEKISLRPPVAEDLEELPIDVSSYKLKQFLSIAERLSDSDTPLVLKKLSWADTQKVLGVITDFLDDGQEIGSKS